MSYDFDEDQITLYVKGSNVNEVGQFLSTTDNVYISFYPNNCNDFLYDNYNKSIIFGAINCNNYYKAHISSTSNNYIKNIMTFDEYNITSFTDIIPNNNNISLGNPINKWKNLYINSNIYIGNVKIHSDNYSNITINGSLITSNIINSGTVTANYINSIDVNIYSNITSHNINSINIYSSNNIVCSTLVSSNLKIYDTLVVNNNTNTIINSFNIYSSNIINYNNIKTNNLVTSNITVDFIDSSNVIIYDKSIVNNLIVNNESYLNGFINITSDFFPTSNNLFSIGSYNKKWKNIYISSNLYIGDISISFIQSNIILKGDLYANNIIANNYLNASNIIVSDFIYSSGTISTSNIISSNIYTNNLFTSNQLNIFNLVNANNIISKNINNNYLISSNALVYGNITSKDIISSNISSESIFSCNIHIYNTLSVNNLIVSNIATLNGVILNNSITSSSNDYYNIGTSEYKFKNIYIGSNIFLGNSKIYSINSNIYIDADIYTTNILAKYLIASNLYLNNLILNNGTIFSSNIINSNEIYTKYLYSSNITVYGNILTKNLNATNSITADLIKTSNINIYNTLNAKNIITSNIESKYIISSNITINNTLNTSYLNVSNILNISGTAIISCDVIPSYDSKYDLGSSNMRWKNLYLSEGNIYMNNIIISSDKLNGGIKIKNTSNEYQSITVGSIKLLSNDNSNFVFISVDNNGVLSFKNNSNTSTIGISYNDLIDTPFIYTNSNTLFTSNIIVFKQPLISSNTLLYGNVGINTNFPKATLDINGTTISTSFQGSFIGDGYYLSNINASNILGVLSVSQGGSGCNILPYGRVIIGNNGDPIITSPNLIWSNLSNSLIVNGNIISKNIYGNFIGNGYGLSNIYASNIIGTLSVINGGTGCNILPYGSILVGNNTGPVIVSSNLIWSNTLNTLNVYGTINTNTIKCNNIISSQNIFIGNGSMITNIISSNIVGIIPVNSGGSGCNILPYGCILVGNNSNPVITSPNLVWSNNTNTLHVKGTIITSKIQGSFIGNGLGLSNIVASNIIGVISVPQGGTGCNIIPYGNIIVGNNNEPVINSPNLIWSNITNSLIVKGSIYGNNIQGYFIGDGGGLSNIISSNIVGILSTEQGGTGCNILPYGSIIIGNNKNPVITSPNFIWSNITNTLNINGRINANIIQGEFIGDGYNISNIISSNIVGIISVSQGGTGCNILPYGNIIVGNDSKPVITTQNLVWSNINNTLNVNGQIYANNIQGAFIGDASGLSNIIASNIKGILTVPQGGTGCNNIPYGQLLIGNNDKPIITTQNILWNFNNSSLNINGNLNADILTVNNYLNTAYATGAFIGDGSSLSNINASNFAGILSVSQGGTGCNILEYGRILIGNNDKPVITPNNLTWYNNTNKLSINGSVYANNIQGLFIGDGSGLSNIVASNIKGIIGISQGGTGCNILPYGSIIVGNNDNPVITTANLTWSNITNTLNINGSIIANNIQGLFIGDGTGLSNIIASNIKGIINVSQGGTGCNILPYGSILVGNNNNSIITSTNLTWSNITNTLNVKGSIYVNNIQGSFIGDGSGLSNIISSNIKGVLSVSQGGTGCNILPYGKIIIGNNSEPIITTNNLTWSNINNTLNVNGDIFANNIRGSFIGDGSGLSNIIASNIIGVLSVSQGGSGCNNIPYGNIIVGNNNDTIITSGNLIWSNTINTLNVNGSIYTNNIQGSFIGDGSGLSNIIASNIIGTLSVSQGGSGCNLFPYGNIIIGNNNEPVITSPNLTWSNITNVLNVNGSIYSKNFQGSFVGDGRELSNIIASNIIGILSVSQGGTGCNILPYGTILIGNSTNPLNTSTNLVWSNITNTLNVNGTIYANNIQGTFIGDGSELSNINISNIFNTVPINNGGTGCNILSYGCILVGNNKNPVITDNKLIWSNITNTLYVNDTINAKNISGYFSGDGSGISNIISSNIIGILSVSQGGSGCNTIPYGSILIGNNSDPVITSSNLSWDNVNNSLNINGSIISSNITANNIYTNSIYGNTIGGFFIGDGGGLSNIVTSNIVGVLSVSQGGTGCNNLPYGCILVGNNEKPIIASSNFIWNNITNSLNVKGNISSSKIYGNFIGNGSGISNIISSNIIGILNVEQGGSGCNNLPYGSVLIGNNKNPIITSPYFIWSNIEKKLIINGDIYASNFEGNFYGSFYGLNLSSYYASNIIGTILLEQGGTGCNFIPYGNIVVGNNSNAIITSSNLYWDNVKNNLNINGNIYANIINGKIYSSNIIGTLSVNNGGTGCNILPSGQLIIGNGNSILTTSNLVWNSINNSLNIIGNIIATSNIYGTFSGDGYNLSNINISNIKGTVPVFNGGTGCNFLEYGNLLIGNNYNPIISSSKLSWNDSSNILYVNGKIFANEIYGSFIGDGSRISNIVSSNLIGIIPVSNGGIGTTFIKTGEILIGDNNNYIKSSSNFSWNNITNSLYINGDIFANTINADNIKNFIASNITGNIKVINGGTGCNILPYGQIVVGNNQETIITSPNFIWSNITNELLINGNINAKNIQGSFIGDGFNISNINFNNIIGTVNFAGGGTGCNSIPYGQLLIGNNNNTIITTNDLVWSNIEKKLFVNGDIFARNIQGKFIGDGKYISNLSAANINKGVLNIQQGGTGCNTIPLGHIIIGNNTNSILTSSNFIWNDALKTLNIDGSIYTKNIQGKFYGDGANISNINASNIIGILDVYNGGTGCNFLPINTLLIGNNDKPLITSSNLLWDDNTKSLNINGNVYAKTIYAYDKINSPIIEGKFYGDGTNISNIIASNIIGILSVANGGTGSNFFNLNEIILGNNDKSLITYSNLKWDNVYNKLLINGDINANNIQGKFYGDGTNISNFVASNLLGIIPVLQGGTGCNNLPYGAILIGNNDKPILTTPNFYWNNDSNILNINGNINAININVLNNLNANKIYGGFNGDGYGISNIIASNIIGSISVINGGTGRTSLPSNEILFGNDIGPVNSSSSFKWDNNLNILTVDNSTIKSSSLETNSLYISNIVVYNSITANNSTINNVNAKYIQGSFYGNGENISNFCGSNITGVVSVVNGGTGCNNLPYGQLIIGNSNSILTTQNLSWNPITEKLYVNGNINANNINIIENLYANKIQGIFYGDGSSISNIVASNIIGPGILPVTSGGTGYSSLPQNQILVGNGNNRLLTSPNLNWNNTTNTLIANGIMYTSNINITNTVFCTNINIANNLVANKSSHNSVYAKNIQGNFYGDGANINNILSSNIIGIISVKNGGTGCNSLPFGQLLIGNNQDSVVTSSNLIWDDINNKLNIYGNIFASNIYLNNNLYANSVYGMLYGDGKNISNIVASNIVGPGILSVANGGTGNSSIPYSQIIIGNDNNALLTTEKLSWDNILYSLNVKGDIIANNLNISNNIYSSNINITNNLTVNNSIHNNIIANNIQGKFIGDGTNISNINGSNIIGIVTVINGGTGCNNLEYGQLLIGNNSNPIITTSNLIWNNELNKLSIKGDINVNNIFIVNNISSKVIRGKFIGDGENISNIGATNIIGTVNVINGGIGTSSIISKRILYGNDSDIIGNSSDFTWDNNSNTFNVNGTIYTNIINANSYIFSSNINISDSIIGNNGRFTSIYSENIQGEFYGDGANISNLNSSNINGVLAVINGGTGCNIIPIGEIIIGNNSNAIITTSNFSWDIINKNLNVIGNIYASNILISNNLYTTTIQGKFIGDGTNISNIVASNIIGNNIISVTNGGTGNSNLPLNHILIGNDTNPIYTTSNFTWDISSNILNIIGSVQTNDIDAKFIYTSDINISNSIICKNANITNLYANNIQGYFCGDGSGLSNIISSNIQGILPVIKGGLGCNILPYGQLLVGNDLNPVITTSNLMWNNNNLLVNGNIYTNNIFLNSNIYTKNIQGKFYGDGTNISNIVASNIIGNGILSVANGGTGYSYLPIFQILVGNNDNPLISTPNFTWNNILDILNVNGSVYATNLNIENSVFASKIIITNSFSANKATFNSSLYANTIQGNIIGDGSALSNIMSSNLIGTLSVSNGGTGCNTFIQGQILIGNGSNPILTSSNIVWDQTNDNLIINGGIKTNNIYSSQNIYANNIYGKFYGDGVNISNIIASNIIGSNLISVSNGGTGVTILPSTRILIGNDSNPIITSANLSWSANTLYLNGTLYTNNINSSGTIFSTNASILNTLTADKGIFNLSLYSPIIKGSFYGDGANISNIISSNIVGVIGVSNGGTGCNILPLGHLLIGNNTEPIITTSNLSWNNNTLTVNGNIISSNISVIDTLNINSLETSNLNIIGWNNTAKIYNGVKYNNKPFYLSLYLSNDFNSVPMTYSIPFSVNYNNNGGMQASSSNVEPMYWNNNYFISPVSGLYSINYSVCCVNTGFYMWINKTDNFLINYNNRFAIQNSYSLNSASTSAVINTVANDNWYFIVYNSDSVVVNNNFSNTKASISLLQETL